MKPKNVCMLMVAAIIWGIAFVAQSVGMDYVGAFTFNGVRSIIAGFVLLPCIALLKKINGEAEYSGTTKDLIIGGVACGVILFIGSSLQQLGIKYVSAGKAGFITAFYIIFVPVLGIFLKKAAGWKVWVAVVLALAGLYFLCITDSFSIGKGDVLLFLCALGFSLHILVIDHFSPKVDGVKMSCIQFFVCGILSIPFMFAMETPDIASICAAWKPILYAGVLSSGAGYTLQIVGQKNMNPAISSLILSLESSFSVLAGWLILGETLSVRESFGCVLMFIAIILAQLPERKADTDIISV